MLSNGFRFAEFARSQQTAVLVAHSKTITVIQFLCEAEIFFHRTSFDYYIHTVSAASALSFLSSYLPVSARGAVSTWSTWRRSLGIKFVPW